MKYGNSKAFTLVELIVVIVILGILGTIGFVSYSGYLGGARDSNRITQLKGITDSLNLYNAKNSLPLPDDYVTVTASGATVGYQGYVGANILELIDFTNGGKDPKDKTYFTYYLSSNKKLFQMLAFLEDTDNLETALLPKAVAADYSSRHPKVYGKKLGILTQDTTNIPIQEISTIQSAGFLDVMNTTNSYNAHISDTNIISGTGGILAIGATAEMVGKDYRSCKEILDNNSFTTFIDGIYYIDPTGSESLKVYCDMTTDGGGWTFFGHMNSNSSGNNFFEGGIGTYKPGREDDGTKYSLGVDNFSHTEMMVTLDQADPSTADAVNKIAFYQFSKGHLGFNKGPIPCQGLSTGFNYKTQIGGPYISGGKTNNCSTAWYTLTTGNGYLTLFQDGLGGHYWGSGMGGNNIRYHDGWWYLR